MSYRLAIKQMGRIRTDLEDQEIRPGCVVAYNWSGQVAKGIVERCPGTHKTSTFSIRRLSRRDAGWYKGSLSKVKNANSILVIEPPREENWDLEELVAEFGPEYGYDFVRDYFTDYP